MSVDTLISPTALHALLISFWGEVLEIEPTAKGLLFTMPASYPDGWQVVLELSQVTPKGVRLSDRGKTLTWLTGQGQNIATDAMKHHLKRLCAEHSLTEEHGVLCRWLELPLDASDIHVFAEGLVAVSRLDILNDHQMVEEDVADRMVKQILSDAGLEVKRKHKLNVTKDRAIAVDYFIEQRRPSAIQILRAKSDISGSMEKWGFRWHELKSNYTGLAPIMLYDRDSQLIDPYSRHIGDTECALFCGYDETDRIHDTLNSLR
ncbi:MAG: hypothetical protein RL015_467 [Verrucomicrobiota bacterium]|jgi:hypothetical protein